MEILKYNLIKYSSFIVIFCINMYLYHSQEIPEPKAVDVVNWTSCEEFLGNHTFNVTSVIDIDWKIFYFWSYIIEESYHIKFSLPNKELIERYRVELDNELNPRVNWDDADLFMETSIDFSGLLIKTNKSGQYRLIPSIAFSYAAVPTPMFGLRVVESGLLGLVNCKYRLSYALAPVDKMPHHDHLNEAALKLGIWSEYNRSHIFAPPLPDLIPEEDLFHEQNDEDDEQIEIDHDPNRIHIF